MGYSSVQPVVHEDNGEPRTCWYRNGIRSSKKFIQVRVEKLYDLHTRNSIACRTGRLDSLRISHPRRFIASERSLIALTAGGRGRNCVIQTAIAVLRRPRFYWDVMPCRVISSRRFEGSCCLNFEGLSAPRRIMSLILD